MDPYNFLNFTNPVYHPQNLPQPNIPQQMPPAPGPNLQPIFQQGIPFQQYGMLNPMAVFDPFWNQRFYAPAMVRPAMEAFPRIILQGQTIFHEPPDKNVVELVDREERGLKRKRSDALTTALTSPALSEGRIRER